MPLPVTRLALWIFKPTGVLGWKADDHDVRPSVVIEIVNESEEIIRVSVVHAQGAFKAGGFLRSAGRVGAREKIRRWPIFVARFEIRPDIPKRSGRNIHNAVVIEISKVRAFRPKLIGQLNLLEAGNQITRSRSDRGR